MLISIRLRVSCFKLAAEFRVADRPHPDDIGTVYPGEGILRSGNISIITENRPLY